MKTRYILVLIAIVSTLIGFVGVKAAVDYAQAEFTFNAPPIDLIQVLSVVIFGSLVRLRRKLGKN
jgi:hypothetical protein